MNCVAAPKTKHAKRRHDCLDGKDDWEVQEEEVDDSSMADHRSILGQTKQYVRQNRMNLGLPLLQALSSTVVAVVVHYCGLDSSSSPQSKSASPPKTTLHRMEGRKSRQIFPERNVTKSLTRNLWFIQNPPILDSLGFLYEPP